MESLVHYALLGSLVAGAAGALVLAWAALKQGLRRRHVSDEGVVDDGTARMVRLADTIAVLCFAVSAGFGVIGLVQKTQPPGAVAVVDSGEIVDRLREVERRLTSAELQLRVRAAAVQQSGWEGQVAELQERLAAVEARVAAARSTPPAARSIAPTRQPTSSASKLTAPSEPPPTSTLPRAAASESPVTPGAPSVTSAKPPVVAPSTQALTSPQESAAPPSAPAREDVPVGEQLRREWETVKSHARSGVDEVRQGWEELKRLFRQ